MKLPEGFTKKDNNIIFDAEDKEMILIPSGSFIMGNNQEKPWKDQKAHEIYLESFYIDKDKITRESYLKFLEEIQKCGGHHPDLCHSEEDINKSHIPNKWNLQTKFLDQPVVGIDWFDAWAYSRWVGKNIPTEAQWEKACKIHSSKEVLFPKTRGNRDENSLANMLHKGWEWCLDWYQEDFYESSPRFEPYCSKKSDYKVARGSIPYSVLPLASCSFRNRYSPYHRHDTLGFRCVKNM